MGNSIELIVGLGNPEPAHLMTRHNAGFWFVDALAQDRGASFKRNAKLAGDLAEIEIAAHRIRLLKPMTYMNNSGRAVAATANYFKIAFEQVLVVYDELDLPPGRAKLKFDGGHAGHNGMRSIIEHCGPEFWRLRLGIGHPGPAQRSRVVNYVLQRAPAEDEQLLLTSIADALAVLPTAIEKGPERAKNSLHKPKESVPANVEDAAGASDTMPGTKDNG